MSLWMLCAALASTEPAAVVDGSVVRGTAWLAVQPEALLAHLDDPVWESRVSGTGTRVEVTERDGDCLEVDVVSPNVLHEARYALRRCRVDDGVQSMLIDSNTFSAFRSRWRVVPEEGGARVTFEVDVTPSLWVPVALVRAETRRMVLGMMRAMQAWAASGGP